MNFSWKSIFGNKNLPKDNSIVNNSKIDYDKNVDFYYTNIINSIILYTYDSKMLKGMAPILIDPLSELYEELEYAFTPVCFETVFKLGLIDKSFKRELLTFKNEVDQIPTEIWDWNFIDSHKTWIKTRGKANILLEKLDIKTRIYDESFSITYDKEGNMIRNGQKL